ncbi:MAG: PilZ domain-containing protein [Oscillospiraceae bacterium]|nr:PilZ domain-containing protein [Oscillospiraceae bacterium]
MPVLDKVLDKNKVVKIEICTSKGRALLTLTKNFTFPQSVVREDERFKPNETILIKGKNLPVFARNASVAVIAHTRAGDRFSLPGHIAVSTEYQLNITLNQVEAELIPDRRRFYKIAMEIPCVLTSITRGKKHVDVDPHIPFIIQDINIGGVFLAAGEMVELQRDDMAALVITEALGNMEFVAKVLRVVTTDEGQIKGYGCSFLFMNARQEEVIAKYINQIQMRRRAEELAEAAEIVDVSKFI